MLFFRTVFSFVNRDTRGETDIRSLALFLHTNLIGMQRGAVVQWFERATDNRVVPGSNPTEDIWKLWQFPLPTLPVSFGRYTKNRWFFYLVPMPGEVKDPTQGGKCVTYHGLHILPGRYCLNDADHK